VKAVGKRAPYSHSLRYLAQQASLELNEEQKELLRTVTRFNIEARYPSKKSDFSDWKRVAPLTEDIDVRIEPMPYRPEDFTDSDPLAAEIMATGEEIKI